MQVGDIVKHFLTEQIGIVLAVRTPSAFASAIRVIWTTQGDSLFGPGSQEWCDPESLEHLTTA